MREEPLRLPRDLDGWIDEDLIDSEAAARSTDLLARLQAASLGLTEPLPFYQDPEERRLTAEALSQERIRILSSRPELDGQVVGLVAHEIDQETRLPTASHPVIMETADWKALQRLSIERLYFHHRAGPMGYRAVEVGTGGRSVAKLLSKAKTNQVVVYRDGDPCNLRRSNLGVVPRGTQYRAHGHLPARPSDGRPTYTTRDGRTLTKRKAWGSGPKERLAEVLVGGEEPDQI